MHTAGALTDLHGRAHRCFAALLTHCRGLGAKDIDRELAGFGYASVRA